MLSSWVEVQRIWCSMRYIAFEWVAMVNDTDLVSGDENVYMSMKMTEAVQLGACLPRYLLSCRKRASCSQG